MILKNQYTKIIFCILVCSFILIGFSTEINTYAAIMRFYNYTTSSEVNYTGTQVKYKFNNKEVPLTYPGIINSGMAMADYEELFIKEIGLKGVVNGNTIILTDGRTVLEFTLGSKTAFINGKPNVSKVAPVKLSFDGTIKYYVPTNFVADAFGLNYVWVDKDNTAKITKTLKLSVNNEDVNYNRNFYSISYENQRIPLEFPAIYHNGLVMAPVKEVFETAGCRVEESEDTICISKGTIYLQIEKNSKIAYVNGKKIIVGIEPLHIIDYGTQAEYDYISLEFVAELLGFKLDYNEKEFQYYLSETEITGNAALHPLVPEQQVKYENQEPTNIYFEWIAPEGTKPKEEYRYMSKVTAYSLGQVDVIELYDISKADIYEFTDNDLFVLELKNILTTLDTQFYADYSNQHFMYALLTGLYDNTKLIFKLQPEVEWKLVEKSDKVQLYLFHKDDVPEKVTIPINHTEEVLMLPVPEGITLTQIQDVDDYLHHCFEIKIAGNHMDFYQNNTIINPYYMVDDYFVSYDGAVDATSITFSTKIMCAYQYTLNNGYIEITVGRPGDIYSKVIVLDAGHGGSDPGAQKSGFNEKDINLTILNNYTRKLFNNSDIKVYFTRETDVLIDLYERAAFASEIGADLFLSLHMNAHNSKAENGTAVFYSTDNNISKISGLNSYLLANHLVNKISSAISTRNCGVFDSNFVVVKYNTVPAVLIELGYMTNKSDLAKITNKTYQQKAAEAIYQSVLEIFEQYPSN